MDFDPVCVRRLRKAGGPRWSFMGKGCRTIQPMGRYSYPASTEIPIRRLRLLAFRRPSARIIDGPTSGLLTSPRGVCLGINKCHKFRAHRVHTAVEIRFVCLHNLHGMTRARSLEPFYWQLCEGSTWVDVSRWVRNGEFPGLQTSAAAVSEIASGRMGTDDRDTIKEVVFAIVVGG